MRQLWPKRSKRATNEADAAPDHRDEFTVSRLYSVKNGRPIREVDPVKAIEK